METVSKQALARTWQCSELSTVINNSQASCRLALWC